MLIPFMAQDKANHLSYGAAASAITITAASFFPVLTNNHNIKMILAGLAGIIVAAGIGLAKEVADKLSNIKAVKAGQSVSHGVEFADAVYTAVGGVLPAIPIITVHLINHYHP